MLQENCYLPIYLELKIKGKKHWKKLQSYWDFDPPCSSTELCCASVKYQTRKRLENIKLSFEGLLRITMCSGNLYTDSVMTTCLLYSDKWHGLEKATLDRWTCHKQQGDQEKTRGIGYNHKYNSKIPTSHMASSSICITYRVWARPPAQSAEFVPKNPAKFDFFFRDLSEALLRRQTLCISRRVYKFLSP